MRFNLRNTLQATNIAILLFSVLTIASMFYGFQRNIGFSEESLYLILVHNSDPTVSFCGPWANYLRLLYLIAHQDIFFYRLIGGLLLFGTATTFGYVVIFSRMRTPQLTKLTRICGALLIGISSLYYYDFMKFTPYYTWMALECVLIASIGIHLGLTANTKTRIWIGGFLASFGLFLATIARPFAGIALVIFVLLDVVLTRQISRVRKLLLPIITTGIVFSVLHFLLISNFTNTMNGIKFTQVIGASDPTHTFMYLVKQSVWQFLKIPLETTKASYGLILIPLFVIVLQKLNPTAFAKSSLKAILLASLGIQLTVILVSQNFIVLFTSKHNQATLVNVYSWVAVTLTILFTFSAIGLLSEPSENSEELKNNQGLGAWTFVGGIIAVTFSSNQGVLGLSSCLIIFYVAIVLLIIVRSSDKLALQIGFAVFAIFLGFNFFITIRETAKYHFDDASITTQNTPTIIGPNDSLLHLSDTHSEDVAEVRKLKYSNLIDRNAKFVNLSPFYDSMYLQFELDLKSIQSPYLVNNATAKYVAGENASAFRKAWLILETDNNDDLVSPVIPPNEFPTYFGRSFSDGYKMVAKFNGRYCNVNPSAICSLSIWKPIN